MTTREQAERIVTALDGPEKESMKSNSGEWVFIKTTTQSYADGHAAAIATPTTINQISNYRAKRERRIRVVMDELEAMREEYLKERGYRR